MSRVSFALTCPACAGPLTAREGDTHSVCPSCGSGVLMASAVRKFVLPASIGATEALRSVRRKLQEVDPGGVRAAKVRKPSLYYAPFWHCTASVSGYILGLDPVIREEEVPLPETEGQGAGYARSWTRKIKVRTGSEAVEREVHLTGSVNISAANLEPLGIPSLSADSQLSLSGIGISRSDLPAGLEVLQDESSREGTFVDPVVPLVQARAQAATYLKRLASGVGQGLEQRWEFMVLAGRRDALIYYPVWTAEFSSGGRTFQTVVDGISGRILRGRFPDTRKDKKLLTFTAAWLWAGLIPVALDMLLGGRLQYATPVGVKSCLPWMLIILGVLAFGTYRFIGILEELRGKGSDSVV
jgi:hypothetical protein